MHLHWFAGIILSIILFLQFIFATPYSWGTHHNNYDASLDPIVWSRSFVKDAIRKPRMHRANALQRNSLDEGEDGFGFGKRRSSYINFNNQNSNNWHTNPAGNKKRINRRKQKLNYRHRYGFI